MKTLTCLHCKNTFESKKACKSRTPKYCGQKCYAESMKINKKCKQCGNAIENKHSVSVKNRVYCSKKCQGEARKGVELSTEWKKALSDGRKKSEKCKGQNLYNYKGGKENTRILTKERYMRSKHDVAGRLPVDYLKSVLIAQHCKCFYCESDLSNYKAIEHLTPLTRGGCNEPFNLVYSCRSCNSTKRQQTLEEYAIKNKRFDWLDKFDFVYASAIN